MLKGATLLVFSAIAWSWLIDSIYLVYVNNLWPSILDSFTHWQFAVSVIATGTMAMLFGEQIIAGVRRLLAPDAERSKEPADLGSNWYQAGVAILLVFVAQILDALSGKLVEKAFWGLLVLLGLLAFQIGLITLLWIKGAQRETRLFAVWAGLAGGFTETILQAVSISLSLTNSIDVGSILRMLIIGLVGGLAIIKNGFERPDQVLALTLVALGFLGSIYPTWMGYDADWGFIALTAGWTIGVLLCPSAATILRGAHSPAASTDQEANRNQP